MDLTCYELLRNDVSRSQDREEMMVLQTRISYLQSTIDERKKRKVTEYDIYNKHFTQVKCT